MNSSMLRLRAIAGRFAFSRAPYQVAFLMAATSFAIFGSVSPSAAQNRFWITNAGGAFASNTNWSTTDGGAAGAAPPVAADSANFTRSATYTVSFSADVTNTALLVANGIVSFDLNGNDYLATAASAVAVGNTANQSGRLTIRDGLVAVNTVTDTIGIGTIFGATGNLTVSTAGRIGDGVIDPTLAVGVFGSGTLVVEDNGRIDAGSLSIGANEGSTGTVTIGSPNAIVDASGNVTVGSSGTGTLTLQNAGILNTAGTSVLGSLLGSNGTVTVAGVATNWTQAGSATLGDAGDAGLTVQAGGTVSTAGAISIGNSATGIGTGIVTGTDANWNMASTLNVGVAGLGNLVVSSGGHVSTSGATSIANNAGGEGNVVVTGSGSRWNAAAITVGNSGAGNLTIAAGGVVNASSNLTIASAAASVGKTLVNGAGSTLNVTGALNVGNLGSGTLTVEAGATVSATGPLTLNDPAGAPVATLNFHGGTITSNGFTRSGSSVFNWTDGTLLVGGGALNNSGANLTINGADLDDLPALRLSSGAQSLAANLPNVTIGSSRQGAAIVSGGSTFQTTTASLGSIDGGEGALHVEGLNSTFSTTGDLAVGGTASAAGGLGTVTLGPGGTATAGGTLRLWNGGTINISGGTLRFTSLAANGGKAVFNSGTVQVLSTFNANSAALDALLGPTHTLGVGRKIETLTNTMNLQSNLTVSGGAVAGNVLAVSADVVARFESGANATFNSGITNPAGARTYITDATVGAGTIFTNGGELHLAGSTATVNAASLANTGLVDGSGRINTVVTNSTAGQIRVAAGQQLQILGASGSNTNNGLVDVDGGSIEFGRSVTNSSASPSTGLIAARDATLRFQAGLLNSGALTFTAGVSDVFGDVTNQNNLTTPGRIIVTGGAQANFFDDVVNNGTIQVSAAGSLQSTAVFLGSLSGNGVSGGGHVFLEGDARPGFSPGTMAFGGDVSFGPLSTLEVELAGTTPGTQFDRVTVAASASVDGTLKVSLLGGFKPVIGNSFQIFIAAGGLTGTFADEDLPALAGGASWDVNYTAQAITLSVGGVLGDFNLDGVVNAGDYTVWRNQLGSSSLAADASGNGSVDQTDYNIWKANFGDVAASGGGSVAPSAAAVPEPSSAMLAVFVALIAPVSVPAIRRKR